MIGEETNTESSHFLMTAGCGERSISYHVHTLHKTTPAEVVTKLQSKFPVEEVLALRRDNEYLAHPYPMVTLN